MADNHESGGGGLLLAFIAGTIMGAAIALLYAPVPGEQTRERLGQRAREGRERATGAARQGREILNRQREHLVTAFDRARRQYREDADTPAPGGSASDREPQV